jgi:hypothetical protein
MHFYNGCIVYIGHFGFADIICALVAILLAQLPRMVLALLCNKTAAGIGLPAALIFFDDYLATWRS